jgi:hypothetical protein
VADPVTVFEQFLSVRPEMAMGPRMKKARIKPRL